MRVRHVGEKLSGERAAIRQIGCQRVGLFWPSKYKARALALGRVNTNCAMVLVNDFLHDAQANAGAFGRVPVAQGLEQQKNFLVVFRGNAGAVVLHPKLVVLAYFLAGYLQLTRASVVVLHGITEQVGEHLLQAQPVGNEGGHAWAHA